MQQQNNNRLWTKICLLLLCVSLVLSVGVAYGRYLQEFPPVNYVFQAENGNTLLLGGIMTQSRATPLSTGWTVTEEGAELAFSVRNGNSAAESAQQEQAVCLRLAAGLSIGAPETLRVTLTYMHNNREVSLTGQAEKIPKGSLLQQTYGEGWIYRFYDALGSEKTFSLPGGKLSYENFTVTIAGGADPTLLQLQIVGSYRD